MGVRRLTINATVTASGGASQAAYTERLNNGGVLEAIVFRNGSSAAASGISTAGHMNITLTNSSGLVLNVTTTGATGEAVWYFPRGTAQVRTGEPVKYGATVANSTNGVPEFYPIAQGEGFKVDVTSAGTASAKKFYSIDFYVRE